MQTVSNWMGAFLGGLPSSNQMLLLLFCSGAGPFSRPHEVAETWFAGLGFWEHSVGFPTRDAEN